MRNLLEAEYLGDEFEVEGELDARNPEDEDDDDTKLMKLVQEMGLDRHVPRLVEEELPPNEPFLWTATMRGQFENVKVLLQQADANGYQSLWIPGVNGPSMILERLQALPNKTTDHTRIMYLLQRTVRLASPDAPALLPAELQ
jgi:hypothetical protein